MVTLWQSELTVWIPCFTLETRYRQSSALYGGTYEIHTKSYDHGNLFPLHRGRGRRGRRSNLPVRLQRLALSESYRLHAHDVRAAQNPFSRACRDARSRDKACDMSENGYFAHESPTYGRPAEMLRRFGYSFKGVGENIAHYGTVEKAEAGFMSSASHRANILGSQWTRAGVGICLDKNGFVYVVQLFAR